MSELYNGFADLAVDLLNEFGDDFTVSRETGETHDPITGGDTGGSTQNASFRCVVLSASEGRITGFDYKPDFESMDPTKQRFVIAAAKDTDFVPEDGYLFGLYEGETWSITGVNPVSPIGIDIVYKFGIQR